MIPNDASSLAIVASAVALALLLAIDFNNRLKPRNRGGRPRPKDPQADRRGFLPPCKPFWVEKEVLRLKALMPDAGCRTIAAVFNRLHAKRGMTVSKSWVAKVLKKNADNIREIRREIRKRKPRKQPKNIVWALDLTTMSAAGKLIFGIIDHGTRACLALRELPLNSSIAILRLLLDAIELYGKPKVLRSDNGPTFTSRLFRFALFWLGIRHQRTEPMAPWQNGRIERFFGTFKRKIRAWIAEGGNVEKLYQELDVFRCWYNHVRPHQNLDGLTPAEAWDGLEKPKSRGQPRFFEEWDGNLTGFL
jgi:putative transposase